MALRDLGESVLITFDQFIESADPGENAWTIYRSDVGTLEVFVRKNRVLQGLLEVANIGAWTEEGGKGRQIAGLWSFLRRYEKEALYAENVLNIRLALYYEKLGWWKFPDEGLGGGLPCYLNPVACERWPLHRHDMVRNLGGLMMVTRFAQKEGDTNDDDQG